MDKKKTVLLILALCIAVLALVYLLVLRGGTDAVPAPTPERTEDGVILLRPAPAATASPAPEAEDESEMSDDEEPEDEPEPEKATPAREMTDVDPAPTPGDDPTVPERDVPAGPEYFSDAVFVGNDTVMALGRYDYDGLLSEATFIEVDDLTDSSYVRKIKNVDECGKIYICLGSRELFNRVGDLRDSLDAAIGALRSEYPGTIIYLMSVTPVSKYRESVSKALRMDRVPEYNEMLVELAAECGVWYIEITSALVDEEGYLPSNVTEDGLNFTPGHYAGWYERIAGHYIGEAK